MGSALYENPQTQTRRDGRLCLGCVQIASASRSCECKSDEGQASDRIHGYEFNALRLQTNGLWRIYNFSELMSKVRVLVGTRKGAFILTSDGKRQNWDVSGPFFTGWEIYHLKGSPVDPNRIFASQTSGWFGQIIQRSNDGGKTWEQPGTPAGEPTTTPDGMPKGESNKFVYDTSPESGKPMTTHMWYDGTAHPW